MSQSLVPSRRADRPVYVVAGGNHVTILLDAADSGGMFDAIEVLAQPGGGPPPHRHRFGEWFRVVEGQLTLCEQRNGTVVCTHDLHPGDGVFVAPGVVHGTLNHSSSPTRFEVVSQPATMTAYFREAGVRVPDELTPPDRQPPGPAQLADISRRHGIDFWTGPVDRSTQGAAP